MENCREGQKELHCVLIGESIDIRMKKCDILRGSWEKVKDMLYGLMEEALTKRQEAEGEVTELKMSNEDWHDWE